MVVHVRTNVGDLNWIYTLNEVGTLIWDLLEGKCSVGQIIEAICRDYEVAPEEAANGTVDFLESLEKEGLIAPTGA